MLLGRQNAKEENYSASRAGTKLALMEDRILEKALGSKMIQSSFQRIKAINKLGVGVGRAQSIILRMRMLNSDLRILMNSLLNWVRVLKGVRLTASIRLVIMSPVTFGGQLFLNRQPIACREITG